VQLEGSITMNLVAGALGVEIEGVSLSTEPSEQAFSQIHLRAVVNQPYVGRPFLEVRLFGTSHRFVAS